MCLGNRLGILYQTDIKSNTGTIALGQMLPRLLCPKDYHREIEGTLVTRIIIETYTSNLQDDSTSKSQCQHQVPRIFIGTT